MTLTIITCLFGYGRVMWILLQAACSPSLLWQVHINYFTHLLQTWTSLSSANNRSVSNLWCMADHLNSGMRNMVVRGPGLNWRLCSSVMGIPLKPKSTRMFLSVWVAAQPCRLWEVAINEYKRLSWGNVYRLLANPILLSRLIVHS